jgi:hypothetical protein
MRPGVPEHLLEQLRWVADFVAAQSQCYDALLLVGDCPLRRCLDAAAVA